MYINKATHRQLGLSGCKGIARYTHTHFSWISICFVYLLIGLRSLFRTHICSFGGEKGATRMHKHSE